MKVWGLTLEQVHFAKDLAGQTFGGNVMFNREPEQTGRAISFTLRVYTSKGPGARTSHRGRRLVSACWHVHLEVMRELFRLGATRIQSAMADYSSGEDLEEMKWNSFRRNVGSMFEPAQYGHLCFCSSARDKIDPAHKVTFGTMTSEGLQNIRQIRQADILQCPHFILVPEHYRPDGSCRCNDATHTEMTEWGYFFKNGLWVAPDESDE